MFVWMKVTKDKYELPVAVADSANELARILNTTANNISSSLSKGYGTYLKVAVEEENKNGGKEHGEIK